MKQEIQLMKRFAVLIVLITLAACSAKGDTKTTTKEPIDRKALVTRHNVEITSMDTLASLSVGNGSFAFTVDATGLQSFPEEYENGVPLGTMSDWGWNSHENTADYKFEETLLEFEQYGRDIPYPVQINKPERKRNAVEFFRENPHRVQLGILGFHLQKENGETVEVSEIENVHQTLNLWTGEIESKFKIEGIPVTVYTASHQEKDAIGVRVQSKLIEQNRLQIRLRVPYPTADWKDTATMWEGERNYKSSLTQESDQKAIIKHSMDSLNYQIGWAWKGKASIEEKGDHDFLLSPSGTTIFEFTCHFQKNIETADIPEFSSVIKNSIEGWERFWQGGGAVDFSGSTDPRAHELERRVVLSQYLTKLQCTGNQPPQETGLTFNSWYGRPHLEMTWWHGMHFPLWGRSELLENWLPWYNTAFSKAKGIAQRQGFDGARWQKMTGPYGNDTPSSVGAFLIWQQPHFITFAELMYREDPNEKTLNKYKERVFATADFMASFAHYNEERDRYELGPGVIPAQERHNPTETFNPTYELAYWNWALNVALEWKQRLNEEPVEEWQKVLKKLSPLPVHNNVYLATENAKESYSDPEFMTDHPSVLGTYGMLPETSLLDKDIMENTFDLVWDVWAWEDTWGWDFPMTAMAATRLGKPEQAIDALFMDVQTNTYLGNGHNYQDERLTIYLPGNGGLLTAIAVMCAGWEGNTEKNPGFPKNGKWNVRWEGLKPMF
ncbi:hypothetical protein [Autumnicola psychrophila]|uniref:Glycoside hydrolase family 65 n=1 Tax=Autumnicola psychrophila TaxID=3075592 RepID=A0ABU3DU24_9FLAO|nr:hypothetical protein [Zunongwangia sp. F225]MDT0687217.1 hypothetical protein [Zunongwangia sp. F225]